ncbi:Signal transduction histidine kinase [Bifidobacterium italicum]|uniref:histidine kinase n=1 Tax=Bifidobacterium italicum TaxID=1960968 RepID=A0A2A2EKP3_9BIFI|nr:histidine kinase [Bifidobacterium italicum]PAU69466.1 Signal transduction histidine kinase [Bifidobacterium italicum]
MTSKGRGIRRIRHPYIAFFIIVFSVLYELNVWVYAMPKPSAGTMVWLMVAQAIVVCCYWFPVWASVAVLLLNGVGEYAIPGYGQFTAYFLFLAVVLISYKTSTRIAAALWFVMAAYTCIETNVKLGSFSPYGCTAFCMVYLAMVVVGRFLAWNDRRNEQLRKAVELEVKVRQLESNQYLAAYLHDALSQELALISMEVQLRNADPGKSDDERWERVGEYASNALGDLRGIIMQLRDDSMSLRLSDSRDKDIATVLKDQGKAGDELLHRHGFAGGTEVDVMRDANVHDREVNGLVMLICHEIYANILKHGDAAGRYRVQMEETAAHVCILYENDIAESSEPKIQGGNGIRVLRSLITSMGGTFSHERVDGVWKGYVELPIEADGHVHTARAVNVRSAAA